MGFKRRMIATGKTISFSFCKMSENVLGFMHHAMKKIINVHGKAAYPKKKLETAGIYRKFIQPIATKCFYICILLVCGITA
jgi:hypothetical protein